MTNQRGMNMQPSNKNLGGTTRSMSVVPAGIKGHIKRKAIREGIDMLEAQFM